MFNIYYNQHYSYHFTVDRLPQPCTIIATLQMLGWKGLSSKVRKAFLWPLRKNPYG